ncbi:MAG: UvrB/UvrC motif-containing protein [Candidatus Staskawiczbacteria bacterium]|nr:UvrB/UvrC motif-containing protein [Candidatus Staskawiczbacteria bacterium]
MDRFKLLPKSKLNELPKTSGVYCFAVGGMSDIPPIYIGKAVNIQSRVKNHFQQPSYRDNIFIDKVEKIGYFETGSEIEALLLEASLIKKHQPRFNVVWKDDKNYFYVAIEQDKNKIPYVFITHKPKKIHPVIRPGAPSNDGAKSQYIGPFVEGTALKMTLKFLRRVFPYYTSARHPKSNCTWCHLGLCPGPNHDLKAYKKNIKKLVLILQGKSKTVLNSLKREMATFSEQNKFEEAGKVRDEIASLQQVMSHSSVITQAKSGGVSDIPPLSGRVECYDVSNIQGKQATGSMIAFTDGKPDKSQYRKFKIKMENTPNDIAMLKEIITRRLNHVKWPYPEVMLIDGGKAQLNAAIEIKNYFKNLKIRNLKIISIAKGRQELFIEGCKEPIPLKNLPQETYNLIKNLDDEAHRFAITYHKKLRRKELLQ